MSDQNKKNDSLSEISHLFLSSIREKQGGSAERPKRIPPAARAADPRDDLLTHDCSTPEMEALNTAAARIAPVVAVLASHLGPRQAEKARQYAARLASTGKRVGMIEIDAAELRVSCFEKGSPVAAPLDSTHASAYIEPRQLADAIEELNCDVDRWVLLISNPRSNEARALLTEVANWTLISTCDHDGIVSCYRTLKGLADISRPRLALAVVDAIAEPEAERIYRKLASVCDQFLNWPLERGPTLNKRTDVSEQIAMSWTTSKDKPHLTAAHWQVVGSFIARAETRGDEDPSLSAAEEELVHATAAPEPVKAHTIPRPVADHVDPAPLFPVAAADIASEVIDLPEGQGAHAAVLSSVLKNSAGEFVECPISPPNTTDMRLAVTRDHRVVLLAVATQGLTELASIGRAYRWLVENRSLLAMAVPQLSIDAHQVPALRLLIDHADLHADVLQSILQSGTVTVQAYRKVRWGQKQGLLLEAA